MPDKYLMLFNKISLIHAHQNKICKLHSMRTIKSGHTLFTALYRVVMQQIFLVCV